MRWSSRRTGLVTLGVSLLLHAALLAWLANRPPAPPPPPANTPIAFEVVESRPPPRPPAPPPARAVAKAPPVKGTPPRRRAEPPPSTPSPVPPVAVAPGSAGPSDFVVPSDAPRADKAGAPSTAPSAPKLDDLKFLSELPSVSQPDKRAARVSDPKAVVDSTVTQAAGIRRAQGSVPAYFADLRRALEAAWDVDRVIRRKRRDGLTPRGTVTVIRLVQDRDGRALQIDVLGNSRDPEVDTGALADLQAAARNLPRPTPDALGSRERLATVWSFEFIPRPPGTQVGTTMHFDIVTLVDKRAIPPPSSKILTLLSFE